MDKTLLSFLLLLGFSALFASIAIAIPTAILPSAVKMVFVLLAVAADMLAFGSRHYLFILLPVLQQKSSNIVLNREPPYYMAEGNNAILRRRGDEYQATAYINIPYYRSATEMTPPEKLEFARQVGRMVGVRPDPVRFSTALSLMDKESYITSINNAIVEAEAERSRATGADKSMLERMEGKIEMWHNVLSHVTKELSLEMGSFATVSAIGYKETEAIELAQQKAREVVSAIGANFGITATIMVGDELSRVIDPEHFVPYATIQAKIVEQIKEEVV